jgi:hypothetical protein
MAGCRGLSSRLRACGTTTEGSTSPSSPLARSQSPPNSGHDLLRTEVWKPLSHHREHNRFQIRAAGHNLPTAGGQLAFGTPGSVSKWSRGSRSGCFLKASRLIQCTSPRNTRSRSDHHHFQMLHLWVLLKKPTALRRQAVLEALIWVHLHFQQHHRSPWARTHRPGGG